MGKIITQCPSCGSASPEVVKICCADCHTTFEGKFEIPSLLKLSEEELAFIIDFVKCSGSLKEMAARLKISYPTLRNRLNELIETLENVDMKPHGSKEEILKLLEEGKISAKDAAKMLHKL
ncbi:MAG: DUF2089 domain-containing protein [Candidatus Babeliales bacterium]|uniref:DUF2089 domain-containing protein n=1 Tax=Candidatus Berkiella aquae TaxID=295108 RepID=A0A0Q9Y9D9_9GAMM|nr:DUF2089 family protein [Candidatus Berkiella aquae]MCS5712926.1 DUF2089 domain-containing protein [Candidatus Berkiella aquae]